MCLCFGRIDTVLVFFVIGVIEHPTYFHSGQLNLQFQLICLPGVFCLTSFRRFFFYLIFLSLVIFHREFPPGLKKTAWQGYSGKNLGALDEMMKEERGGESSLTYASINETSAR